MGLSKRLRMVVNSVSGLLHNRKVEPSRFKFHFIHIPKNGGSALRHVLQSYDDISLSSPYHYRYLDIVDHAGRDLQYFCVIRNPWSRTASRYMFARQSAKKWPNGDPRREYILSASFEEYVKDQKILPIPKHPDKPWMGPMNSCSSGFKMRMAKWPLTVCGWSACHAISRAILTGNWRHRAAT